MDLLENRLLVMDDDPDVADFFGQVAEQLGFEVVLLSDPAAFFDELDRFDPQVIVLDLQMPGRDGIELLSDLADAGCAAKIVIASGLDSRVVATAEEHARSLGLTIIGAVCKPVTPRELGNVLAPHKQVAKLVTAEQLERAIDNAQLRVHYLPKATRKGPGRWIVEGAEALVRWEHEEYGMLYPDEFIGLAEETGLITGLTDYVFRAAMEQQRVWFANGLYMELGVNISAQFLSDLEFPDRLLTLIKENNLDPSMITLELNETSATVDPEVMMAIMARLRVQNVKLCYDDFGAGSSSLTHLYRMPFSEFKLDNAFVADLARNQHAQALVEGLIYLAKKLKMEVCAEGVEDETTLNLLDRLGCHRAQGHHLGPAVRPKALEQLVENWNSRFRTGNFSRVG